jgi:hypothetical protein
MDKVEGNRKLILSAGVRFYRETCCQVESHCVNAGEEGYMKGMLEDLSRIRVAMTDVCSELNMRRHKVISPVDLLGIHVQMNEDELIGLLGEHPVHMSEAGYNKMAEVWLRQKRKWLGAGTGRNTSGSIARSRGLEGRRQARCRRARSRSRDRVDREVADREALAVEPSATTESGREEPGWREDSSRW